MSLNTIVVLSVIENNKLKLNPGDLKINRCLQTNIGNVHSKPQDDICETDKDLTPQIDRRMDGMTD